jgi:hypothetical protein
VKGDFKYAFKPFSITIFELSPTERSKNKKEQTKRIFSTFGKKNK